MSTEVLWHEDALCQALPGEPPGDPVPGGSWEVARRLVAEYRIADPAIVRARWDPATPLLGRRMVLRLRLWRVLSVQAPVRVARVWDDDQGDARAFGFEYETLPGHVEAGRMDYEVRKRRGDGGVEFRVHAWSRPSGEGPWWARLGLRLFGRREQVRFYFRCCERIARLTARELGVPGAPPPPAVRLCATTGLTERAPGGRGRPARRRRARGAARRTRRRR